MGTRPMWRARLAMAGGGVVALGMLMALVAGSTLLVPTLSPSRASTPHHSGDPVVAIDVDGAGVLFESPAQSASAEPSARPTPPPLPSPPPPTSPQIPVEIPTPPLTLPTPPPIEPPVISDNDPDVTVDIDDLRLELDLPLL